MQRLTRSSQPGRMVVLREVSCSIPISLPATEDAPLGLHEGIMVLRHVVRHEDDAALSVDHEQKAVQCL
ncbi:hypothetical protein EYF80_033373 [Liparis tanakae]|uniref:Uncharacterized protein n=1 Tax=Liparis tanakae TaxID=230148 RepID=A0A4Z2GUM0_9TELE|nr:hypothetical protein EYF80_033373 [Liparis tanakae]